MDLQTSDRRGRAAARLARVFGLPGPGDVPVRAMGRRPVGPVGVTR